MRLALPQPATSVLREGVTWTELEELLTELGDRPGLRVTYDRGTLELMSPGMDHEGVKAILGQFLETICDARHIDYVCLGSLTMLRPDLFRGLEPDACYYIAKAAHAIRTESRSKNPRWLRPAAAAPDRVTPPPRISPSIRVVGAPRQACPRSASGRRGDSCSGSEPLDFRRDPPPDLVIEVEVTRRSLERFPIYAAFGVPEIWRCETRRGKPASVEGYRLGAGGEYQPMEHSFSFPWLRLAELSRFVAMRETRSNRAIKESFRAWMQEEHGGSG
jgi:Uma2 family endonuclease